MKQKLALAMDFLEDSQILILDESLNALDEDPVNNARSRILAEKAWKIDFSYKDDIHSLCNVVYKMKMEELLKSWNEYWIGEKMQCGYMKKIVYYITKV